MKRLYKSRTDRVFAGVCGGVGEYFNLDPVLIRIIWVIFAVLGGSGILAYIIGMIIIPEAPEPAEGEEHKSPPASGTQRRSTSQTVWGVLLIAVGLIVLLEQFHVFRYFSSQFWHVSWSVIFPIFIILVGVLILFRTGNQTQRKTQTGLGEEDKSPDFSPAGGRNAIIRPRQDRKIAGVCSGLAYYLNIDPTIIRLLWVIGTFATGGVAVLLYIILAVVLPEGDPEDFTGPATDATDE